MKLITEPMTLLEEFTRLIQTYDEYWFLTYSIGNPEFPLISDLIKNRDRIRLLVASAAKSSDEVKPLFHGAKMFSVHEKALSDAMSSYREGDMTRHFHSKVYLFRSKDGYWEAVIGSFNLTRKSFGMIQASVLISSHDDSDGSINAKLTRLMLYEWYESIYSTQGIESKYDRWLAKM